MTESWEQQDQAVQQQLEELQGYSYLLTSEEKDRIQQLHGRVFKRKPTRDRQSSQIWHAIAEHHPHNTVICWLRKRMPVLVLSSRPDGNRRVGIRAFTSTGSVSVNELEPEFARMTSVAQFTKPTETAIFVVSRLTQRRAMAVPQRNGSYLLYPLSGTSRLVHYRQVETCPIRILHCDA